MVFLVFARQPWRNFIQCRIGAALNEISPGRRAVCGDGLVRLKTGRVARKRLVPKNGAPGKAGRGENALDSSPRCTMKSLAQVQFFGD
jgi:hypothetical protein